MEQTENKLRYSQIYKNTIGSVRDRFKDFYENPESKKQEPFRIFGNLYYVGDKQVCMHLIDTGEGLILIDCGYGQTTHMIEDSIRALGFAVEDLRWIIVSHGHFDHFGSGNELRRRYGCKVFMSRVDAELIRERPERALCFLGPDPDMEVCWPDQVIEDGDELTLGNTTIHFRLAPGHTMGTLAFFFHVTDGKTVKRAGCWGGVGFITVYKQHSRDFGLPENKCQLMLESIGKLRTEHVDIHLGNHPGNNNTLEKYRQMVDEPGTNPFLDSSAWAVFLANMEAKARKFMEKDD